jgi:hypothetical protein
VKEPRVVRFSRPRRLALTLPLLAALLAGCGSLFTPDRVVLSEADLAAAMTRNFPLQRQLLDVLDVKVSPPRLTLLPQANRLGALVEVSALDKLFGQSLQGRIAFETGLRFEPSDQSIRMTQVRVTDLRFDEVGVKASRNPAASRLGAALAERVLEDLPLHHLRADQQQRLAQAGVQPGEVTVTARGVEIKLDPLPR